jgi:hypothetical protein
MENGNMGGTLVILHAVIIRGGAGCVPEYKKPGKNDWGVHKIACRPHPLNTILKVFWSNEA